uniref:CSON002333 protein n=1 Tax=Culicoides sonorensis TaxID=179676 RepID=A0A336MK66_CULSO
MSFDLDDPLGDLLSDGSNDSFFGETPKKSTVGTGSDAINKKDSKLTTSTPKVDSSKSKLDELFGIKTQDDPKTAEMFTANIKSKQDSGPSSFGTSTRAPGTPQQNRAETPAKSQSSSSLKKSQTFDRDDDILSDLGFDIKPKPKSHSKASILDEIMGVSEQAKPSSRPKTGGTLPVTAKEHFDLRPKTSSIAVNQESNTKIESSTMMSRQSTITSDIENVSENTVLGGYTPSIKRSGRRQSTVPLKDPLGLYSQPEEPKSSVTTTDEPKIPKREEIPQKIVPTPAPRQDQIVTNQVEASPNPFNYDNKAQLFVTSTLNTDNAISSLKQQEMQLAVAAQIKSQELALTDMQNRQETLLRQQELQFNELLQKQLQRQAALEENIKRQQERINAHINLLMTQPASALYFSSDSTLKENKDSLKRSKLNIQQSTDDSSTSDTDINKSEINFKTEIKQLELEKLRLEDLLSNINANHENEINFMENSYKKQIKLLEESLQKTEERLRAENKSLQEYYFHKIDDIENEKQHLVEESNAKLKAAKDEYEENIKEIKKKYENDLETMENNYKDMIQNIRQSKLLEFSVLQENGNYLETLRNASKLLENANEGLGTLKIDLHEKIENVYHERESQLRMREMKVEKMENLMLKDKEKSDEERSQLLELVKSLEIKLNSLEQTSNEENWNLKQKFTALEVEKASFEREKTFIREQLTREQKRIEVKV